MDVKRVNDTSAKSNDCFILPEQVIPTHKDNESDIPIISATSMGYQQHEEYYYPTMANECLKNISELYLQQQLCDVELCVPGSEPIKAHRIILAGVSPYFRAMFTNGYRECGQRRVEIQNISYLTLVQLIRFAYLGVVKMLPNNVCDLAVASQMVQMSKVTNACCRFLERQLGPENCIGIANFAQQHSLTDLYKKANEYIDQYFNEVSRSEEFLELPFPKIINIIRKDEIYVRSEVQVFDAVIRWIKQDPKNRCGHLKTILQVVRCHFLSPTFLEEQLEQCELVKNNPKSQEYLRRIINDLNTPLKRYYSCCNARNPRGLSYIYVTGGFMNGSLSTNEGYNLKEGLWEELPGLPLPRTGLGSAFATNKLYAVGGRIFHKRENNICEDTAMVHAFDFNTGTWSQMSAMHERRHRMGITVLEGHIYVTGGSDHTSVLATAERYNIDVDVWLRIGDMPSPRFGHGSAAVCHNMYVIGGKDNNTVLADCMVYNHNSDMWSQISPMSVARSGLGVCAYDRHIYAIGGHDGTRALSVVERYNIETDTWEILPSLRTPRSALGVAAINGAIYAIGGYNGENYLQSVEMLDTKNINHGWKPSISLSSPRTGHAVCVSRGPFITLCEPYHPE